MDITVGNAAIECCCSSCLNSEELTVLLDGAAAIGGLKPFILNIQGDNITANGPQACFRGQSMEPCTHFPQKLACRDSKETAEHSNWIQNHIKECQDKEGGLQLVDHAEDPSSAQLRE